ncbi:MAG: hypothetical protein L6Q76_30840, partial [Polyangiaceae bacterium]|nr:hypothetical protein [Polyangiaceae bacterium]
MTSFGRAGWSLFLLTFAGIVGVSCATGTDQPPSSSEGGGGSENPSTSSSASSGGGGLGGMGGGGSGGAGGMGGGSGGGAPSAVIPSIETSSSLFMNCMPGSTPAVTGSFNVKYDNTAGMSPALAKVTSAKLSMTHLGNSYEWSFPVMPDSSIVPSGTAP